MLMDHLHFKFILLISITVISCIMAVGNHSLVVTCLVLFLVSVISAVNDDPLLDRNSEEHKRFLDQLVKLKTTGLPFEEVDDIDEFRKNVKKMSSVYGFNVLTEWVGESPSPSASELEAETKKKKGGDYKGPVDELDSGMDDLLIRLAVADRNLRQLEEGIADHLEDALKISSSLSAVKSVLDQQVAVGIKVYQLLGKLILQSKKSVLSIQQLVANYKRGKNEDDGVMTVVDGDNSLTSIRNGYHDQIMKWVLYTDVESLQAADNEWIEERLKYLYKSLSTAEKKEKNLLEIVETFLSENRNLIELGKQVTLTGNEDDSDQIEEENRKDTDGNPDEDEDGLPSEEWNAKLYETLEKYQVGMSMLNNSTNVSGKRVKDEL